MSETIETGAQLAIIPPASVILVDNRARDILSAIAEKVNAFQADISTEKGRKACASMAAQIATAKMDLVRLANGMMESDKARIAAVLGERKIIEERMDELKVQVRQPLTDFENAEKARVAAHEAMLAGIVALLNIQHDATSDDIEARIDALENIAGSGHEWQEFTMRAAELIRSTEAELRVSLHNARASEHQAEEIARLQAAEAERAAQEVAQRQAEREARIAREAGEFEAKRAREEAARETIKALEAIEEVERRAEADRQRAEKAEHDAAEDRAEAMRELQRAQEIAERKQVEAIEAERARAAREAAEAKAEADRRAADINHRKRINNELLSDLKALEMEEARAKALISAIVKGSVRHLSIGY